MSVYVAAPLCAEAEDELASHGATAGHYEVAVRCLAPSETPGSGSDLAVLGANSRRATEDTASVATLEAPGPATRFSRAILESAGVPLVASPSTPKGMERIIQAIEDAGTSDVRNSVRDSLEPS